MLRKRERGFALIEVVVSIALLAIIGAGFLGALSTSSRTLLITDIRQTAKNLAEMQMEFIKSQDFDAYVDHEPLDGTAEYVGYTIADVPSAYAGFSVKDIDGDGKVFGVAPGERNGTQLQKIVITIQHQGKDIITIEGYKEKPKE